MILQLSSGRERPNCSNFNYLVVLMKNNKVMWKRYLCLPTGDQILIIDKLYYHSSWNAEEKPDLCLCWETELGSNSSLKITHSNQGRSWDFLVGRSTVVQWKTPPKKNCVQILTYLLIVESWTCYWISEPQFSTITLQENNFIPVVVVILKLWSLYKYLFHTVTNKRNYYYFYLCLYLFICNSFHGHRRECASPPVFLLGEVQWTEESGGL